MSEQKKAIDMTPEKLKQWLSSLTVPDDDDIPCYYFSDSDPYLKHEPIPENQPRRKIRAVQKAKGERGVPLTTSIPYGYAKDKENPQTWLIDPEAASVVKRIFDMYMSGRGPSQITKKRKEVKVNCPTVHWMKMGRNAPAKIPDNPYDWVPRTITGILEKQEYLGHMVNFKTCKQSYKSKKKLENPPD